MIPENALAELLNHHQHKLLTTKTKLPKRIVLIQCKHFDTKELDYDVIEAEFAKMGSLALEHKRVEQYVREWKMHQTTGNNSHAWKQLSELWDASLFLDLLRCCCDDGCEIHLVIAVNATSPLRPFDLKELDDNGNGVKHHIVDVSQNRSGISSATADGSGRPPNPLYPIVIDEARASSSAVVGLWTKPTKPLACKQV